MLDWFVTLRLLCIFEPEVELLRLLDIGCLFRAAYEYYGLDSLCFVFPSIFGLHAQYHCTASLSYSIVSQK